MLNKLKEYKEFIAIIIFFLGGFMWLENQFPKKADLQRETGSLKANLKEETGALKTDLKSEIKSLDCLLEKYMTLTQLQIRGRNLEKEIMDIENEIRSTFRSDADGSRPPLSPAMRHELGKLEEDLSVKKKDLRQNQKDMENINNELARNVCGKVEE